MKKSKQLVFIDDSGDPGFVKNVSSSNFVMAAALFVDPETATAINQEITKYRQTHKWRDDYELKFAKLRKDIVLELLRIVAKYDFQIYAVYMNKADFPDFWRPFVHDKKLYNWATKALLMLMPLDWAVVRIDGKYDKNYRRYMKAFIRRNLNFDRRRVADFDALDSKKDNLVQLADLIVGSIHRSFQLDKTDANKYIKIIKNKIIVLKDLGLEK